MQLVTQIYKKINTDVIKIYVAIKNNALKFIFKRLQI